MDSSWVSTAVTILLIFCFTSEALTQNEAGDPNDCFRAGKCIEDQQTNDNITCFGVRHPYRSFSFAFTGEEHIWMVQSNLSQWERLRYVPKCWAVLQPLLCAVYYPKCTGDQISKVPYKLCEAVQKPCRIVLDYIEQWPPFLQCTNTSVFTSPQRKCQADHSSTTRRLINYDNVTSTCLAPYLLKTDQPKSFYRNVDGCGLSCTSDAQYSQDEQWLMVTNNKILVSFEWICGIIALFTMLIKTQKKLMEFIFVRTFLFRSIFALAIGLGVSLQFSSKSVYCEDDGTLRVSGGAPAFICGLSFFLVYVSELMDLLCLVGFGFALSRVTNPKGENEKLKSHLTWFIIISFIGSMMIGSIAVSLHGVEGDSLVGICHISKQPMHQAIFVIGIQGFLIIINLMLYLILAIKTYKLKTFDVKVFVPIAISLLAVVIRVIDASLTLTYFDTWTQSLLDFLICQGNTPNDCPRHTEIRPNLLLAILRSISYFVPGFMTAVYVFTLDFRKTWKDFLLPKLKGFVNKLEGKNDDDDHDGHHQEDGLSLRTLSRAVASSFRSRQNSMTSQVSQVSLAQSALDRLKSKMKRQRKQRLSRISRNHSTRSSLQSSINSHDLNMSQHSLASNWQIFNKMSKPRTNQKNSRFLTLDVNTIETQTSLTDLSGLATHKSKEEKSTQCNLDQATGTTTTSSSQTEYKHPIDAHVTKIHVHHGGVSSEDSVPSQHSMQNVDTIACVGPVGDGRTTGDIINTSTPAPLHRRGRRGGIGDADVQLFVH